jgi:putative NIF3 family GTP cyclohydrolase 1 type 2
MQAHGRAVKTIDGISYEISYLTGSESLRVFSRLAKVIGPGLASFRAALTLDSDTGVIAGILKHKKFKSALSNAINNLTENFNEDEMISLAQTLLKVVRRSDLPTQEISLDNDFMGKTKHLLILLKEVVAHNFQDVFSGGGDPKNTQ